MFLAHVAQGRRWVGDMLAKFIKSSQIKDRVVDIWALSGRKCIFDIAFDNTLVPRVRKAKIFLFLLAGPLQNITRVC